MVTHSSKGAGRDIVTLHHGLKKCNSEKSEPAGFRWLLARLHCKLCRGPLGHRLLPSCGDRLASVSGGLTPRRCPSWDVVWRPRPNSGSTLGCSNPLSERPLPAGRLRLVDAVLVGVIAALDLAVHQLVASVAADGAELRHPVDGVHRQAEAIDLVLDRQLQRRVDVASLLVAADVQVSVVGPPV